MAKSRFVVLPAVVGLILLAHLVLREPSESFTLDGSGPKPTPPPGLPQHRYDENGLLYVNPDAPHPVFELMKAAEERWQEKHQRASKTLQEAVAEYRRRYGRSPPPGFDVWWDYVQANNVRLPDEYDLIHEDLEYFWGIDPHDLQKANVDIERAGNTFVLGKLKEDDPVSMLHTTIASGSIHPATNRVILPVLSFYKEFGKHLPPFRAVFVCTDNALHLHDDSWKTAALQAASAGRSLRVDELPKEKVEGWGGSCPPESPFHQSGLKHAQAPMNPHPFQKTFIHDFRRSKDPCTHPQHTLLHSEFLSHQNTRSPARSVTPLFTQPGLTIHNDIHYVTPQGTDTDTPDDYAWSNKSDSRLLWRGTNSGMRTSPGFAWKQTQRYRLAFGMTGVEPEHEIATVLPSPNSSSSPVGLPLEIHTRRFGPAFTDIHLTRKLYKIRCSDDVCTKFQSGDFFVPHMKAEETYPYKYILDVDGFGWSSRFRQIMSMNSAVFKSTLYREWFSDRLEPWLHFIPVQLDYSDLYDLLYFFVGDISGKNGHDDLGKRIGAAGRHWVYNYFRREDMIAYMFRLNLEYVRVIDPNRASMNFEL